MKNARRNLTLSQPAEIATLTAPVRQELLAALDRMGRASVAELATHMGRSPNSLYYHVKLLEKFGIIRVAATRKSGKRDEALYVAAAKRITIGPRPGSKAGIDATEKVIMSMLRMTGREAAAALRSGTARREGADRELFGIRGKGRITRAGLRQINRHVQSIQKIFQSARCQGDSGALIAFTAVLTPCREASRKS